MALVAPRTKEDRKAFAEHHKERWIKHHPEYLALLRELEKAKAAAENPPHHKDIASYLNGARTAIEHVGEVEKVLAAKERALSDWWSTNAPGWVDV